MQHRMFQARKGQRAAIRESLLSVTCVQCSVFVSRVGLSYLVSNIAKSLFVHRCNCSTARQAHSVKKWPQGAPLPATVVHAVKSIMAP